MTKLDTFIVFHNELVVNGRHSDKDRELEYDSLKKEIEEKLEKYDAKSNLQCPICHFEYYKDNEQQIKQLKEELEIQKVLVKSYQNGGLYTQLLNCNNEIQSLKSQLEEKDRIGQKVITVMGNQTISLRKENEKLQKVIDGIRNRIKKIEDEYPYSNNCKPSDTNSDYILLKSILKEIEKE